MAECRSVGLDVVRSVAILLVLFSHSLNNISFWFGCIPPARALYSGDLGVPLFFALSGLLICRAALLFRWVKQPIRRLRPRQSSGPAAPSTARILTAAVNG